MKIRGILSALLIGAMLLSDATSLALARNGGHGQHNGRGGNSNSSSHDWKHSSNSDDSASDNSDTNEDDSQDQENATDNTDSSSASNASSSSTNDNNLADTENSDQGNRHINITPRSHQAHLAQVLSDNQQNTINRRIDNIPLIRRLDFLLGVLSRIETLRTSIEASTRSPAVKARLVALLDSVTEIIQSRISDDIGSGSGVVNDNTPPVTMSLNIGEISTNTAVISATMDESGTGHFVVLQSGSLAPGALQVKAGQNASGVAEPSSGSGVLVVGLNQFNMAGLAPNTNYIVYFVAEDDFGNLQTSVMSRTFTTGNVSDTTPPVTSAASLTGITSTTAMLQVTSSESGTLYGVSLLSGATAPNVAQVKALQDASGATADLHGTFVLATGMNQFNLTGFTPNTNYVVYLVAQDTAGNLQTAVTNVGLKTNPTIVTDTTPPVSSSFDVIGIGTGSASVAVNLDEPGTIHFVVLQSGATAPSPTQIKAHENANGIPVDIHDIFNTSNAGANQFNIAGLSPSTNYVVYFVAEDATGNLQTTATNKAFSTPAPADITPPVISELSLTGITNTGAILLMTSSETGTGFKVVLLSGSTAPTIAQIKAGQDATGADASIHGSFGLDVGTNQFHFTGFAPATNYTMYVVVQDKAGNTETTLHTLSFTTQ